MSRTHKNKHPKGCGWEYWSRRPCAGWNPGTVAKTICRRIERRRLTPLLNGQDYEKIDELPRKTDF